LALIALVPIAAGMAYWFWPAPPSPPPAVVEQAPPLPPGPPAESPDAIVSNAVDRVLAGKLGEARTVLGEGAAEHPDAAVLARMSAELSDGNLLLFQYETPEGVSPVVPLWIADGVTLTPRDNYRFVMVPARTCFVYGYQRDPRPTVTQIFPNSTYSPLTNPLAAGRTYWLPEKSDKKESAWMFLDTAIGEEQVYFVGATRPLRDPEALGRLLVNGAASVGDTLRRETETFFDTGGGPAEPCFANNDSYMEIFRFNHR
jgi:hypothetical protein